MSKGKLVLVSLVWLGILAIGVLTYRLWYVPTAEEKEHAEQEEVIDATSGSSQYQARVRLGLDAFSGYAILRSDEMNQQLRTRGIKLDLIDDGADYQKRLSGLAAGELQMAAFPIDALLRASQAAGSLPATIVAIIDETRGADALVAYKSKFPTVDSLNSADTKFVLVGDSPSETLVRVLLHDFQLDAVHASAIAPVSTEREVIARYKAATPQGNEVFVTWEPVVSELLVNDQMHVLIDTSSQSGYIVDALVVSRDYLIKNQDVVRQVVESYFRARYAFADDQKLAELVRRDANEAGSNITPEQAQKLVSGILWKNTQENMAHFGLQSANVPLIEDLIDRIKRVLLETKGLENDPTGGDSRKIFYEQVLSQLQTAGFHPGTAPESVRGDVELRRLSDQQWEQLTPVGTLSVPPLVFARGTAKLTGRSQSVLDELVEKLKSWPQYYVMIRGNAGAIGDATANRRLAKQRADAALQYLQTAGVADERIRAIEGELSGDMSVTFVLGQPAY
ncbi:MAG: phosphate ABC transporter substrate-binding/OmpA family protein [Pirellulaceae bacterium]